MVDGCSTGRGPCKAGIGISWNDSRRWTEVCWCWTCDVVDERRLLTAAGAETDDDANDESDNAGLIWSLTPGTVRLFPYLSSPIHSYTHTTVAYSSQYNELLTSQHCRCRRLVGLPLATAPFWWLQRRRGTVCHQRLGPAPHFWHSEGRPSLSLTFSVSRLADLALFISVDRLRWAVQQLR